MSEVDELKTDSNARGTWWIVLATVVVLFLGLGETPVERTSEKRCHEVASTMLETGDFLVPYYDGEPRLQKPPLYYWLAAASAATFGGPNGFTTRLPAALAALATALLVCFWTRRRFGAATGIAVLACFVTMNQFPSSGRRGDAESMLMFTSLLALFAFYRYSETRRVQDGAKYTAAMTLAVLSKATAAFLTVLAPIVAFSWFANPRPTGIGAKIAGWSALGITLGLAWYGVLVLRVDGAFDALFGDLVLPVGVNIAADGDAEHYRAPWYYVSKLFTLGAPASIFVPALIWRLMRTRGHRDTPALRFVWLSFAAMFIAFSLLPQKQRHYLLPLLPLFSILVSDSIIALWRELPAVGARIARAGGVLAIALGVFGATWLLVFFSRFDAPATPWDYAGAIAAGCGAIYAGARLLRLEVRSTPILVVAALSLMALHEAEVETYTSKVDAAIENDEPVPETERLYAIETETPWLLRLYDIDGLVEDLRERDEELGIPR